MKLNFLKDKVKDTFFDVELSTGRILKKVSVNFIDGSDDFINLQEDNLQHIVAIKHIVKITPHINGEIPLFSFT